jgi:ankyrin repeat protein
MQRNTTTRLQIFVLSALSAALLAAPAIAQQKDLRLLDAVKRRDEKAFTTLIHGKADVNAAQPDGSTALAWAAHLDESVMANALLAAGANVNAVDEYGETPLTLAAANGDAALVQRLLEAGANARATRWNGESAVMIAAGAGNVDTVRQLVLHGADPGIPEPRGGQTPLMWAAAEGHGDVVHALIEIGASVTPVSKAGFNALAFAVEKNDEASIKSLLAAGADPNFKLRSANTLLLMAMGYRHSSAALALLDAGADIHARDRTGNTALHMAAQVGDIPLVKKLLASGADPNARTAKASAVPTRGGGGGGRGATGGSLTPLMVAARSNQIEAMRALVAGGADPSLRADDDSTLLMFGAAAKLDTVKYAFELDPHVDVANKVGQTPVHASLGFGGQRTQDEICQVIQFLADKGAKIDEMDQAGRTPISIADFAPIDKAVDLLTVLIEKSGAKPKIPSKR